MFADQLLVNHGVTKVKIGAYIVIDLESYHG